MSTSAQPRDINLTRLPNGIVVISEPMPAVRSVSVGLWIGTGSRCESAKENGISHFIEHMLFKGTPDRNAEDIARQMDSLGGHLDAFTGRELVGYNTKVLDEHLPIAFEILSDMVLHPLFDQAEIDKEKGVILEELKMEHDNPEAVVHELFVSNFWSRHPIGRPILGTKKTIASFHHQALRDYHGRFYRPENITITAAGSLRHEELVELASRHFASLEPGPGAPGFTSPDPKAPIILKNKRSLAQVHLCLGMPCYPTAHPLRFAAYTLNVMLGGGMSSRLFQNIRERQGLAYAIFSELNMYRDAGCMAVYAGTSLQHLPKMVDSILAEFRSLKNDPIPDEELRRAKDHMKGSLLLSLESTSSRMGNLARQWMNFGRFITLDELAESIEKVTADEVQAVAREFLAAEKISAILLGKLDGYKLDRDSLAC